MQVVDYLIAGGGGAGLGLACALLDSPLGDGSIVIVDRDRKQQNDRTWCFWGSPESPFTGIAHRSWDQLVVRSEDFERVFDLQQAGEAGWRYWMVRGIDFYEHARQKLQAAPNVRFLLGDVERIEDGEDFARVTVNGETWAARWVFDSIVRPAEWKIDPSRYHNLKQHFLGWEIETEEPQFNPRQAVLFDFATPQGKDLRFLYILPLSETRALVEYTLFSASLLPAEEYEQALRAYIGGRLGIAEYHIHASEQGVIPMTDYPFARRGGKRILHIGTKGGLVKPSTGYAFKRMQQDARAVVDSLVRAGHPFDISPAPRRYLFYDSLLLQILYRQGGKMKAIFSQLFQRNPILRVFHFLDEDASFLEDLRLIASLPPGPFLRALVRVRLLRRI